MLYFFFRACIIPVAFVGWLIFQLFVKKKKFAEIDGDIKAIVFFLAVWILIYFFLLR